MIKLLKARFLRWVYLITKGMWKGECAVDIKTENAIYLVVAKGRQITKIFIHYNR